MSGWVIVTGPPGSICRLKSGTTEPDEPSTLPKRTIENTVRAPLRIAAAWKISSAARFEAPITLVGRTALSVEMRMQVSAPVSSAARATASVPKTLLRRPCCMFASTIGTCL